MDNLPTFAWLGSGFCRCLFGGEFIHAVDKRSQTKARELLTAFLPWALFVNAYLKVICGISVGFIHKQQTPIRGGGIDLYIQEERDYETKVGRCF